MEDVGRDKTDCFLEEIMKKIKQLLGMVIMCLLSTFVFAQNPFNPFNPFNMEENDYHKLLEQSIISEGNNFRLKQALNKIKNGEKTVIAAIGGSVTEGAGPVDFKDGYAYQFFREIKKTYAPDGGKNVYFNNAGLSGTPSLLGCVRYQSDVVKPMGQTPDILIIEFAVNDGGEVVFQRSFEALVRDALAENPKTAVIALYAAANYGNTSSQKKPISDYYKIPQINMLEIVKSSISTGKFSKSDYYTDSVHPTKKGHTMMKDCLMNLIKKVDNANQDEPFDIPKNYWKSPSLSGIKQILGEDKNVKISKGSFNQVDKQCQSIKKTNQSNFPVNWHKPMDLKSKNEPFTMEIKCKSFVFVYKVQSKNSSTRFGKAEVYIDGRLFETFDGAKEGGWNNCEQKLLFYSSETRNHKIEVKMAEGSEKLGFTIVAMGYVE